MPHLFMCVNERPSGCKSCGGNQSLQAFEYAKKLAAQLSVPGSRNIKVTKTGCMGHCASGPIAVVYPDNIWYGYSDFKDISNIIKKHLIKGEVLESLSIDV